MRSAMQGTYNGDTTFCPVNAYGECPYCDQCNVCHMPDPLAGCEDWRMFWPTWDEWINADTITDDREDFAEEEIDIGRIYYGYDG